MKTTFFIAMIISVLLSTSNLTAQTYHYNSSTTFVQNGYIYKCDVPPSGLVHLYNQANIFANVEEKYKNGDPLSMETKQKLFDGELPVVEEENYVASLTQCLQITHEELSPYLANTYAGSLGITITINTNTGRAIEVEFSLYKRHGFATIPVTQYREVEQRIKTDPTIMFTLSDFGKQLNRVKIQCSYEP